MRGVKRSEEFGDGRAVSRGPGGAHSCPEISFRGQRKIASQEFRLTQEKLISVFYVIYVLYV